MGVGLRKARTTVLHSDGRRSHEVMEEFYGKHSKPILSSDCYTAYNPLDEVKQKCWSHLLDDNSNLESGESQFMHRRLKRLYSLGKFSDKGHLSTRKAKSPIL